MRTGDVTRGGRVHALLAAERIVARTRTGGMRTLLRGRVALRGVRCGNRGLRTRLGRTCARLGLLCVRRGRLFAALLQGVAVTVVTVRLGAGHRGTLMPCRSRSRLGRRRRLGGAGLRTGLGDRLRGCLGGGGLRLLLALGCAVALRSQRGLELALDRGLNGGGCRLDEFPHILQLLQHGLAVEAKVLGDFIYAWFCHYLFSYL